MKDFKFVRSIGKGSFGEVFAVESNDGADKGKIYAMKMIDKKVRESAKNELKNLKHVLKCQFVINLKYAFQSSQRLFLILEYMNGGDLRKLVVEKGPLSDSDVRFYSSEIVLGLLEMHEKGLIHADLKPENILIDKNGHVNQKIFCYLERTQ